MFESTHSGYGGQTTLDREMADRSFLSGIGQTTVPGTNIIGSTANEAYDRYKASGATEDQLSAFARSCR